MRRAGRDVLVHRRLLVVPRDSHACSLGDVERELSAKHTRRTGRRRLVRFLVRSPLLRNDQLHDQVVGDLLAVRSIDGGLGFGGGVHGNHEFAFDGAVGEVCLPACFHFVHADVAGVFVLIAFTVAAEFLTVFGAGWADVGFVLLNAPGEFPKSPPGLSVVALGGDTSHSALDREFADGMNDVGKSDVECQVRWREDANAVLVVARTKGAVDGELTSKFSLLARRAAGAHMQGVFDAANLAVGGGGELARDEMGKGQFLHATAGEEEFGLGEEVPLVEVLDLGHAFATPRFDRALCCGGAFQEHLDALQFGFVVIGSDLQSTGDQCAG